MDTLRYAWRSLSKRPAFAMVAVAILIGGISGATAMFSFVNSFILRSVPYPDPETLLHLRIQTRTGGSRSFAPAELTDLRANGLPDAAAYLVASHALQAGEHAERITAGHIDTSFFQILGVQPVLGRALRPDDEDRQVVLLSHEFWQRQYHGDPAIVGKPIELDRERFEIVGVLPAGFLFNLTGRVEAWHPLLLTAEQRASGTNRFLRVIARLPAEKSLIAVNTSLERLSRARETRAGEFNYSAELFATEIGRHTGRPIILTIFAVTIALLLIACSNVANLLLVRAFDRRRPIAIQLSLGATSGVVTRQLLTETLIVFLTAGWLSVLAADRMTSLLTSWIPEDSRQYLPHGGVVTTDASVLLFSLGLAAVTGLLFGLAPALQAAKVDVGPSLKESGSAVSHGRNRNTLQRALVVAQVLLATTLLISVGLLVRNFRTIWDVPTGFDPERLTTFEVMVDEKRYASPESRIEYFRRALDALPPALKPAAANFVPFAQDGNGTSYSVDGRDRRNAWFNRITPNYFDTLGIPVKAGRALSPSDRYKGKRVAVVSEGFAAREFPNANPLGRSVQLIRRGGNVDVEIVGVCGDVLHNYGDDRTHPAIYVPFEQDPESDATFVLRGDAPPMASIRQRLAGIDPFQPVWQIRSMPELMRNQSAAYELSGQILLYFGLLALGIAVVGLYSVIAYTALQRSREYGIRGALGATPADIVRLVTAGAASTALYGLLPGIAAAFGAAKVLVSVIPGFGDPEYWIFPAVVAMLLLAIAPAALLPAWRASRIDPLRALRHD